MTECVLISYDPTDSHGSPLRIRGKSLPKSGLAGFIHLWEHYGVPTLVHELWPPMFCATAAWLSPIHFSLLQTLIT